MDQDYFDGLNGFANPNSMSNALGLLQKEQNERLKKQNDDFAASQRNHYMARTSSVSQPVTSYNSDDQHQPLNNVATNTLVKTEPKSPPIELTKEEVEEIGQAVLGLLTLGAIVFAFVSFLIPGYLSYQFLDYHLKLANISAWAVFFISLVISVGYYFLVLWLLNKNFPNLDEDSMVYLPLLPHAISAIIFWYVVFV